MIKQDYIERLFQDIARMLSAAMGKGVDEALEYIDESGYKGYLGLDKTKILNIPNDRLVEELQTMFKLNIHQLEFLAELMNFEATKNFELANFDVAKNRFEKTLILFEEVDARQELFCMDRNDKVKAVKAKLAELSN